MFGASKHHGFLARGNEDGGKSRRVPGLQPAPFQQLRKAYATRAEYNRGVIQELGRVGRNRHREHGAASLEFRAGEDLAADVKEVFGDLLRPGSGLLPEKLQRMCTRQINGRAASR